MDALAKRLDGVTFSLNYSSGYISNFNLRRDNATEEYRSNLATNITYRHKLYRKPIYVGTTVNFSYIIYHQTQFDSLNMALSPFITFSMNDLDYSLNVSQSLAGTVATEIDTSSSTGFNGDVSGSFSMPSLLRWLAGSQPESGIWSVSISADQFKSESSPIFDAVNYTLGGSINQSMNNGWRWTAGYNLSENINDDPLGNDFAYTGNSLSLQITKFLGSGLSLNGSYSVSYFDYTNPDSATLFTARRQNLTQNSSLGINYFIGRNLRLFATMGYQLNESNLPTGFILSPGERITAVGIQSSSLGDYKNATLTAGMSFNF